MRVLQRELTTRPVSPFAPRARALLRGAKGDILCDGDDLPHDARILDEFLLRDGQMCPSLLTLGICTYVLADVATVKGPVTVKGLSSPGGVAGSRWQLFSGWAVSLRHTRNAWKSETASQLVLPTGVGE